MRMSRAAAVLAAVCLVVFWPALGNGFVWDDWQLIVENPALRGLDGTRLWWMATSFYRSSYQPLGWLAYALIHAAWGLNPFYFHAVGVALHILCAVLLLAVARRLFEHAGSRRPAAAAFAAALLWAVHPLQVGTAAWSTEIPDQLATVFFLGALLTYLSGHAGRRLALALVLFALSGLCRWKGIYLPVVLVALDFYPLKRLTSTRHDPLGWANQRVWAEKLAFAVVAVVILFMNSLAKASSQFEPSLALGKIARGLLLFPGLLVWPVELLPLYDLSEGLGTVTAVGLLLLGVTGLVVAWRRVPVLAVAGISFIGGLLPPLLNVKHGLTLAFPHYAYLSTMGLFIAVAAALDALARRRGLRAAAAVTVVLALFWGSLSNHLVPLWGDEVRLWTRMVVLKEDSVLAHGNLGSLLARAGRHNEAYFHFEAAKRLSVGSYRWNQLVQHRNLMTLKMRVPGLKPDLALFKIQSAREQLEFGGSGR